MNPSVVCNSGASFGVEMGFWPILVVWIALFWWRLKKGWQIGWVLLLFGGGLNIVERLRYGCVRDYWSLPIVGLKNNFNDWLIFVGLLLIVGGELWRKKSK